LVGCESIILLTDMKATKCFTENYCFMVWCIGAYELSYYVI